MHQSEFPTDLLPRENSLPVNCDKIVTVPGVRRCGKSSKMELVINELLRNGINRRNILWVSFDDERLVSMSAEDLNLIIEAYRELYPEIEIKDVYVFFDEIQLIPNWEYFVMRLFKHHTKNIYISGSNATMLSTEMKSALRGWPIEELTYPLSFREYCEFKGLDSTSYDEVTIALLKNAFYEYNRQGGFPEVALTVQPLRKTRILQNYFDTMLLKDLAEHYEIKNIEVLRYLLKRIMTTATKPVSILSIYNDIKSRGMKVAKDDLYRWVGWACEIFMFLRLPNYSKSLSKVESSQPKYYCIDNGLRDAVLLPQSDDNGKRLESTVFLQLQRNKTAIDAVYYFKEDVECDFVVQHGQEIAQLIQVTWDMNDDATRKRELKGLLAASRVTGCDNLLIITAEESCTIVEDEKTINIVTAWEWLLGR